MKLTKILHTAAFAGKIILESGGETHRVEDVINRVCEAYGVEVNCYSTITGIMATARNNNDEHESITIRVKSRTFNLDIIHKVNTICYDAEKYSVDGFYEELLKISREPAYSKLKNLGAYAFVAALFTLLFGGTLVDSYGALIIGITVFLYMDFLSKFQINVFFKNCMASALLTFFAIIFKESGLINNINTTISGTIMLLVPGMALTNSVSDLIEGDYMAGMARGTEAFLIATSLAAGSGFVMAVLL